MEMNCLKVLVLRNRIMGLHLSKGTPFCAKGSPFWRKGGSFFDGKGVGLFFRSSTTGNV